MVEVLRSAPQTLTELTLKMSLSTSADRSSEGVASLPWETLVQTGLHRLQHLEAFRVNFTRDYHDDRIVKDEYLDEVVCAKLTSWDRIDMLVFDSE